MAFLEKKVVVISHLKGVRGKEEQLEKEFLSLLKSTQNEEGCIEYHLYRSSEDSTLFLSYGKWDSMEYLEKHREKPYVRSYRERSTELLSGEAKSTMWEEIG